MSFDGVNELVEYDGSGNRSRYWVHGISYIDERLMMFRDSVSRPYYYVLDRMYNVRRLVDRAGAIVERYVYDGYGRPYIRETAGRGDMDNDTVLGSTDTTRFTNAKNGTIWDPRADLDDDGDVDAADQTAYNSKQPTWDSVLAGDGEGPTVAQAFSDVGNLYMFQGVPHFSIDSASNATAATLPLNHHRARYEDTPMGRWLSRDPATYNAKTQITVSGSSLVPRRPDFKTPLFDAFRQNPPSIADPDGLADTTRPCIKKKSRIPSVNGPEWAVTISCDPEHPFYVQLIRRSAGWHVCREPFNYSIDTCSIEGGYLFDGPTDDTHNWRPSANTNFDNTAGAGFDIVIAACFSAEDSINIWHYPTAPWTDDPAHAGVWKVQDCTVENRTLLENTVNAGVLASYSWQYCCNNRTDRMTLDLQFFPPCSGE